MANFIILILSELILHAVCILRYVIHLGGADNFNYVQPG